MDGIWNILLQSGLDAVSLDQVKHLYLVVFMISIVVTIISIARYVIGFKSLKVYVPIVTTFAFYEIGYRMGDSNQLVFFRGLVYGLVIFTLTFIFSTLVYKLLQRFRLHYIPKLSLVLTGVSTSVLVLIFLMIYFERNIFLNVAPFVVVMMIIVSEEFMAVLAKKNFTYTLSISIETLLISVIAFIIISLDIMQKAVFNYPYIIIIIILLNILIGRFTGLRFNEYWRFRNILLNKEDYKTDEKPKPTV
ncbi:MAG: 7TM domain-containing protein [Candidatus Dojkabacteria bacterium]